jgi:hypothetical protein
MRNRSTHHWNSGMRGREDRFEVPVDGFVIDIVRDDLLIEIQTRNFSSLKRFASKVRSGDLVTGG